MSAKGYSDIETGNSNIIWEKTKQSIALTWVDSNKPGLALEKPRVVSGFFHPKLGFI